jgi:hypothetical protein
VRPAGLRAITLAAKYRNAATRGFPVVMITYYLQANRPDKNAQEFSIYTASAQRG